MLLLLRCVAMRLVVAAICAAGMGQRYPVIASSAAHDTSCTIPTCAVCMDLRLYFIHVRVMNVCTFIVSIVDAENKMPALVLFVPAVPGYGATGHGVNNAGGV